MESPPCYFDDKFNGDDVPPYPISASLAKVQSHAPDAAWTFDRIIQNIEATRYSFDIVNHGEQIALRDVKTSETHYRFTNSTKLEGPTTIRMSLPLSMNPSRVVGICRYQACSTHCIFQIKVASTASSPTQGSQWTNVHRQTRGLIRSEAYTFQAGRKRLSWRKTDQRSWTFFNSSETQWTLVDETGTDRSILEYGGNGRHEADWFGGGRRVLATYNSAKLGGRLSWNDDFGLSVEGPATIALVTLLSCR